MRLVQCKSDLRVHAPKIAKHFMVPESDHPVTFFGQNLRPRGISLDRMLTTVNFDDQLGSVAGKVCNEMTNRNLAAKVPVAKIFAQYTPHGPFRVGHVPA